MRVDSVKTWFDNVGTHESWFRSVVCLRRSCRCYGPCRSLRACMHACLCVWVCKLWDCPHAMYRTHTFVISLYSLFYQIYSRLRSIWKFSASYFSWINHRRFPSSLNHVSFIPFSVFVLFFYSLVSKWNAMKI